jgi:protein TonB
MPDFAGAGFQAYLKNNIKYPVIEKEAGKQGTVYVSFVVEKDGSITNVKEAKGVPGAPGLTKEAIRVISAMPKWKPGLMNGHPVRIEMKQPVRFVLQ